MIPPWKDPVELFELVSGGTIAVAALARPEFCSQALRAAESRVFRLAAHLWTSVLLVGALGFAGSAAVSLLTRMPEPTINDEFAHLLAADTFASGRLSNPTHPMWIHFESFHINQKPAYVSKFPPAQGLILALGQVVSGLPMAGVWLSSGLACGAICWMLQGWFRPGVAFFGGLLAVCQIGIISYWTQSYWGGMMPALGSALIFGGMKRILSRPTIVASLAAGVGFAILANSRPFEGLLSCIPVIALLGFWCIGRPPAERSRIIREVAWPMAGIGLITLAAMGYYNFRQTGNPLTTAYQVNAATYQVQPIFRWGQFRELPVYHHAIMREYYARDFTSAQLESLIRAKAPSAAHHVLNLWEFYGGALLALPFLVAVMAMAPFTWSALAAVLTVCGGLILSSRWVSPHYAAPMTGPFFILVAYGWQRMRVYRLWRRPTGLFLARGIVVLSMLTVGVRTVTAHIQSTQAAPEWPYQRAAMERQLKQTGGYHLILVRYAENHHPEEEWVYNRADIDRAHVVWAREMDAANNQALLAYFHTRSAWLLEPDAASKTLIPYPAPLPPDSSAVAAMR